MKTPLEVRPAERTTRRGGDDLRRERLARPRAARFALRGGLLRALGPAAEGAAMAAAPRARGVGVEKGVQVQV